MRTLDKKTQQSLTPAQALQLLKDGNNRFTHSLQLDRNLLKQVNETSGGQYPFAIVLSCIDSRTSAELIFDLGLGDIFNVRIAGNILNEDILGSMELACKVAGAKLILVLGHSACGAVKGACANVELGHLTGLLRKIQPSIESVKNNLHISPDQPSFVEEVAKKNVLFQMEEILLKSPIIRELQQQGEVGIAGAYYDVHNGEVEFLM